jgi:hypothetical protein
VRRQGTPDWLDHPVRDIDNQQLDFTDGGVAGEWNPITPNARSRRAVRGGRLDQLELSDFALVNPMREKTATVR